MTPPPSINPTSGLAALKELMGPRNLLGALAVMRSRLGNVFRLPLNGFAPVVLAGPEAAHFALVERRTQMLWRNENDPVTELLGHGVLVEDGDVHEQLRREIAPSLHRREVEEYIGKMWARTNQVIEAWQPGKTYDMLLEMRRLALLIVMDTLFDVDITPEIDRLMPSILKILKFISPGLWLLGLPRRSYERPIAEIDNYLYGLIKIRRKDPTGRPDLLSRMIEDGLEDALIRDQMLTLLIAGHDTSTALLAWALSLIGSHPDIQSGLYAQASSLPSEQPPTYEQVASLALFEEVINETLRLYPPIHAGNRLVEADLTIGGCEIPRGSRVLLSYYSTHHDETHWPNPDNFDPGRFSAAHEQAAYTFLPFGGGPRNCLGAHFARVEAMVVLGRLIQTYEFIPTRRRVHLHMGATLEPSPGVFMMVRRR